MSDSPAGPYRKQPASSESMISRDPFIIESKGYHRNRSYLACTEIILDFAQDPRDKTPETDPLQSCLARTPTMHAFIDAGQH